MPNVFSFFRAAPACLLAAILTGCVGGTVDPAHQASAKRIGVVSVLGDEAHGQVTGLPAVFFTRHNAGGSADFNLDAAASAHAANRLRASHPGSAVVDLRAERDNLHIRVPERVGLFNVKATDAFNKDITDAARQLATRHALNLVVMIVPAPATDSTNRQEPTDPGYGLWSVSIFGARIGDASVFANFSVEAFDGATGQLLSIKVARVRTMVDDVPMRASLDAYSPAERAKLAEALRELVLKALDEQLAHMRLTPDR